MCPQILRISPVKAFYAGELTESLEETPNRDLGSWVSAPLEEILDVLKKALLLPGGIVGIPTETVYGLAANIHIEESLRHIFEIKQRPLNDPLIVHVNSFVMALKELYDVGLMEAVLILYLANRFAPGPLTIVARSKSTVSKLITNDTGFVGVRVPRNDICLRLLRHVGVPLAAPSANKFGHISPTHPEHVVTEFRGEPFYVLDGGNSRIGIESTVLKITSESRESLEALQSYLSSKGGPDVMYEHLNVLVAHVYGLCRFDENNTQLEGCEDFLKGLGPDEGASLFAALRSCAATLEILRRGAVTSEDLRDALERFEAVRITDNIVSSSRKTKFQSPGLSMLHYAPNAPTYLVHIRDDSRHCYGGGLTNGHTHPEGLGVPPLETEEGDRGATQPTNGIHVKVEDFTPAEMVLIDVGMRFKQYAELFLKYIPVENEAARLASQLYSLLRRAEDEVMTSRERGVEGAVIGIHYNEENVRLHSAILDRLTRASLGRTVYATFRGSKLELTRR